VSVYVHDEKGFRAHWQSVGKQMTELGDFTLAYECACEHPLSRV